MYIIQFLIASASITAGLVWLGKFAIEKLTEVGIKKYEHELKVKSDLEFEKFRNALQLENQKKHVQFTSIHENQLLIIENTILFFREISDILNEVKQNLENKEFVKNMSDIGNARLQEFQKYFSKKSYYFPSTKSDLIQEFFLKLPVEFEQSQRTAALLEHYGKDDENIKKLLEDRKALSEYLEIILSYLTQMFREMIGVE